MESGFYFNASEAAALLGKNKYRPKEAAMLLYLQRQMVHQRLGNQKFPEHLRTTMSTDSTVLTAIQKFAKDKTVKCTCLT